jgi:glycosyltransferase involved in cell wall biosynthesis
LLFAGRLVPEKGSLELLRAMPAVWARHPDSVLVVAGAVGFGADTENEFTAQLRQAAEPYRERIVFTGFRPPEEMPALYLAADLFVAPSCWDDPSPLVLYEAAAAGLPVVSTKRGGIPEIVQDGVTGVLVDDAADTDRLADAIEALLADEDRRREMGERARQRAEERFSWEYVAERTAEVYRTVLMYQKVA